MSTFMANKGNIVRKWYILDAAGKPLGKTAAAAATLLRGLKETKYRLLMQQKPELAMQLAVRGMLPRNIITKDSLSRLHIYRGAEHPHTAQKPETWAAI